MGHGTLLLGCHPSEMDWNTHAVERQQFAFYMGQLYHSRNRWPSSCTTQIQQEERSTDRSWVDHMAVGDPTPNPPMMMASGERNSLIGIGVPDRTVSLVTMGGRKYVETSLVD